MLTDKGEPEPCGPSSPSAIDRGHDWYYVRRSEAADSGRRADPRMSGVVRAGVRSPDRPPVISPYPNGSSPRTAVFSGLAEGRLVQLELSGDAAEAHRALGREAQIGPCGEIPNRASDHNLIRIGYPKGPGGHVDTNAPDVVFAQLDLTGVDGRPDVEPDATECMPQIEGTAQRPGRERRRMWRARRLRCS